MKNRELSQIFEVLTETGKFEAKSLDFSIARVKIKKIITPLLEEFNEILKDCVSYTEDEIALIQKVNGVAKDEAQKIESENADLVKSISSKNEIYYKKHNELMDKEVDVDFPPINVGDLPSGLTNDQFEILYPLIKT